MATFSKTTNISFQKYGEVFSEFTNKDDYDENRTYIAVSDKKLDFLFLSDDATYFRVKEGVAMIVVTDDINKTPDTFVIHRVCKINPCLYYNFVTISNESIIELTSQRKFFEVKLEKPFVFSPYVSTISVKQILGDYYVVRGPNYVFPGEVHNFWELTYVDDGELYTTIDGKEFTLKQHDLVFYAPGQKHSQKTKSACSYLTVVFDMNICDDDTRSLIDRVIKIGQKQSDILSYFNKMTDYKGLHIANLMTTSIQMLVVSILTTLHDEKLQHPISSNMQNKYHNELLDEIAIYIQQNIYEPITVEEICYKFSISRSSLQALFNSNLDVSPKQYISDLKFSKAKQLIKSSTYSISEIARICGFSSIHYFSRKFKETYGITPSSYAKSIN